MRTWIYELLTQDGLGGPGMRFLSLFSGIEAASLAWTPLGWECVALAEVDPFACAVLAHRYPEAPSLGDVTAITKAHLAALGQIDLVVAGFPCQDVSIAGQRAGLERDGERTRSGLFWEAARIVRACGARWTVLENVPGLFSSHGGRDFAAVVGALAGCAFDVPDGGWRNAGVAAGPDGLVEWAVLDAQFFGLAQRRARVFLVCDSGAWADRHPVLLEPESLCGHPAPRREAWEGVARPLAGGAAGGSGYRNDADTADNLIAATLRSREHSPGVNAPGRGGEDDANLVVGQCHGSNVGEMGTLRKGSGSVAGGVPFVTHAPKALVPEVANSLTARYGKGADSDATDTMIAHSLRADGFDASEDGTGRGVPLVAQSVAFQESQSGLREHEQAGTLRAAGPGHDPVGTRIRDGMSVRRLTPRECERLQGFPDDWTLAPYRSKPAADGPRYRAIGNSMAVPVMRWIGERIMAATAGTVEKA